MSSGYTPLFSSLTTGTLCGRWPDIGLWPIVLSLADKHGVVDVTPQFISGVTGLAIDEVAACMQRFCLPDPASRSNAVNGARLALLEPHRDWGWRVVNFALYRERARLLAKAAREVESGQNKERMQSRSPETVEDRRSPPLTAETSQGPPATAPPNANADSNAEKIPNSKTRSVARKRAASEVTEFPEGFALDDAMRAQALSRASDCNVDEAFAQFRARHQAKGSKFKDWRAAWVTWIGNFEAYGYPKRPNGSGGLKWI